MKFQKAIATLLVLASASLLGAAGPGAASAAAREGKAPRISLWLMGDVQLPADSAYKDIFGSSIIAPRAQVSLHLSPAFHLFASYTFNKKDGTFTALNQTFSTESKQSALMAGAGFTRALGEKVNWFVQAGAVFFSVKQTAMDMELSESMVGFMGETGLQLRMGKSLLSGFSVSYRQASKDVAGLTVKPGGLALSMGLGLQF